MNWISPYDNYLFINFINCNEIEKSNTLNTHFYKIIKYTFGIYVIRKKVYQGEYVIDLKPNGIRLLDK